MANCTSFGHIEASSSKRPKETRPLWNATKSLIIHRPDSLGVGGDGMDSGGGGTESTEDLCTIEGVLEDVVFVVVVVVVVVVFEVKGVDAAFKDSDFVAFVLME